MGEVVSDSKSHKTSALRRSFRRDPRINGCLDLEAGQGHSRDSSVMSGAIREHTSGVEVKSGIEMDTRSQMSGATAREDHQEVAL